MDEIAFQTNLLALNAGRRSRARRRRRAAASPSWPRKSGPWPSARPTPPSEIKTLISTSTAARSRPASSLVGQTGEALQRIVAKVGRDRRPGRRDRGRRPRNRPPAWARSTARSTRWIRSSSRTPPWSSRSTAAAHSLKGEAKSLAEMVRRALLRVSQAAGPPRRRRPSLRPPRPRRWSRKRQAGVAPVRAGPRAGTPPWPVNEDWEEFSIIRRASRRKRVADFEGSPRKPGSPFPISLLVDQPLFRAMVSKATTWSAVAGRLAPRRRQRQADGGSGDQKGDGEEGLAGRWSLLGVCVVKRQSRTLTEAQMAPLRRVQGLRVPRVSECPTRCPGSNRKGRKPP
ncbi:hypothetical protein ACRAWD_12235 [Caulobacter segnis]